MKTALYTTACLASASAHSNEWHAGAALLPERFRSTSVPASPTATVVEAGVSDQYDLPMVSETPIFESMPTDL